MVQKIDYDSSFAKNQNCLGNIIRRSVMSNRRLKTYLRIYIRVQKTLNKTVV